VPDTRQKIKRYLKNMPPDVLGVCNIDSIEILEMTPGAYNLNYHFMINQKDFIFRINIEQQSGLTNQIKYEYKILKFLASHSIAPKAYHIDDTKNFFNFDILIEEFLDGPYLIFEEAQIIEVAKLLVNLHSLALDNMRFITWEDPLRCTFDFVKEDLNNYAQKKNSNKTLINLSNKLMAKSKPLIDAKRNMFRADSLNHTDMACDNFIKTSEGLRLIDWEKPRVDDCSYDICCFISEPAQRWCSLKVMNAEEQNKFFQTYVRISGKNADLLWEKVKIREPLISLHWILWGANKLCDLRDRHTVPELLEVHEKKTARYERIARPENIEKILDMS